MFKTASFAALATLAVVAAPVAAESSQSVRAAAEAPAGVALGAGKMLYGSNGQRIAAIYRVNAEGNPQIILNGKLVTVPASSLSDNGGKVTTSLTKTDLVHAK